MHGAAAISVAALHLRPPADPPIHLHLNEDLPPSLLHTGRPFPENACVLVSLSWTRLPGAAPHPGGGLCVWAESEGWAETFSSLNLNAARKKNAPRGRWRSERRRHRACSCIYSRLLNGLHSDT